MIDDFVFRIRGGRDSEVVVGEPLAGQDPLLVAFEGLDQLTGPQFVKLLRCGNFETIAASLESGTVRSP